MYKRQDLGACVANLIKVWFRDLPVALFQCIPIAHLSALHLQTPPEQLEAIIVQHLKQPQQSIFRWLLDLCCDVTNHSDTNKMTAVNLAIWSVVFSLSFSHLAATCKCRVCTDS